MRPFLSASVLALFASAALAQAPRAAFPSPCLNGCYNEYRQCIEGYGSEAACSIRYNQCFGGCDDLIQPGGPLPEPIPRTQPLDLGYIWVGQSNRVVFRVTNNVSKGLIKRLKATLYASWTPPDKNNIGKFSGPYAGPFSLTYGQRWELKAGEGQNVAVDFNPTERGKQNARLYLWWESYTHFHWETVFDVTGNGVNGVGVVTIAPRPGPGPGGGGSVPPGVSSGRYGGTETVPLWMAADAGTAYRPPLWTNLNGLGRTVAASRRRATDPVARVSVALRDVLPPALGTIAPVFREPDAVIGGSNAIESLAADYVDPQDGVVRAVVLAFRTRNDVYAHVYPVCSRVKGAWLESVRFPRVGVPGADAPATFWESTMTTQSDGAIWRETATSFAVYASADAKRFTVDSHWLAEQYPRHGEANGEILTFQVWAPEAETMTALRAVVLERFRQRGGVEYRNTAAVADPDLFLASGSYGYDSAELWVENHSAAERTIELDAVTWNAANPQSRADFHFTRAVPPGRSTLSLPMPARLNGVIYANEKGSSWTDMVYFADGSWFSFGESAPPNWTAPDCPATRLGPNDLAAAGCARLATPIPADGWRGVGRSFATPTRGHVDVANMSAVSFFARGDARTAELQVASLDADGKRMVHHAFFTPAANGRQITIPFDWLEGLNELHDAPFTGERVTDLSWNYYAGPHAATDLTVGNVFFTADMVAETSTPGPSVPPGLSSIPIGARFATAAESAEASVLYRRAGETNFVRVPLRQTFDVFGAEIPAQPAGAKVEYYFELGDDSGRAAAVPPDGALVPFHFMVSARATALLDDFDDALVSNRLGGAASTFHSSAGSVAATYDGADLRLGYDVTAADSFSGWASTFRRPIDAAPYDSIALRVRGERGGERLKLGLADSSGREHKILAGKYLPGGLSTSWRDVRIPLRAFPGIDRRDLRKLVFVFESRTGAGAGVVEIDDVVLAASGEPLALLVDNFDDGVPETALGGSHFTATGGAATVAMQYAGGGARITASGPNGSWATAGFDLRGVDAASLTQLALSARGAAGGERVHVYLASGETRRFVEITLSSAWQRVVIPLAEFARQGVDLTKLDRLELVWEYRDFNETVDVDDVAFEGS